jgi:DNA-binding PadR family transcriptional regulator
MSVRHALLGLIAQQPRHGYELHAAFLAMLGGAQNWDLKPAQVYTTLTRLEKSGLVTKQSTTQDGGPQKVIYEITSPGRQELDRWLAQPVKTEHQRDAFFLKLMLCLATGDGDPRQVLYSQRASLYQELHELTTQRADANPHCELAHILLMDQAIMRVEADLRWLEMVEARLDEISRQPIPQPELKKRGRPPLVDLEE